MRRSAGLALTLTVMAAVMAAVPGGFARLVRALPLVPVQRVDSPRALRAAGVPMGLWAPLAGG